MGRVIGLLAAVLFPLAVCGQDQQGAEIKEAGVCGRCHVISAVEWGMSGHRKAGTGCTSCHGESTGHVLDERNNVKPERIPRAGAIASLCQTCHAAGCPKSGQKAACQTCHHAHALVNPSSQPTVNDEQFEQRQTRWERYSKFMEEGDRLVQAGKWDSAQAAFRNALQQRPEDVKASEKLKLCERRLKPGLPGFEAVGSESDAESGLPRKVRVAGLGIPMALVSGGEFEMGSEKYASSRPVHTVRVGAFYLGVYEITQAQWTSVMGSNSSAFQGEKFPDARDMPVEQVSWADAQVFVNKLNENTPGGGFRLPTEAEWESAARAGGAVPEPAVPGLTSPRPVGKGQPDKLGLYDMLGNVWEWCSSLDRPYPFDAADGRESATAPGLRILRGGGFADPQDILNPAFRHTERPDRRLQYNGLRLARDVPEPR